MRRSAAALLAAIVTSGSLLATARPAVAADATVSVSPATGLAGGDTVTVEATGLPGATTATLIQCDIFVGDGESDCGPSGNATTTSTSSSTGDLRSSVVLRDPAYRSQPFGDPVPVYCRADNCRIFVVWTDVDGNTQSVASDSLEFTGSPATITLSRSTDLRDRRHVKASGTAYGAEKHRVMVVEEACFAIIQASGCYGTVELGNSAVRRKGTWKVGIRVQRFLADGTDCTDPGILGACQITARILDKAGAPDDSFGVSRIGQPGAPITFRSS